MDNYLWYYSTFRYNSFFIGLIIMTPDETNKKSSIQENFKFIHRMAVIIVSFVMLSGGICGLFYQDKELSSIIKPVIQENYPNATNYYVFLGISEFEDNNINYSVSVTTNINDENIVIMRYTFNNKDEIIYYDAKTKKEIKR